MDKPSSLTPEEKHEEIFRAWLVPEGVSFIGGDAQASYQTRLRRLRDTVELRVPDRVPFMPFYQTFPAFLAGFTIQEVMRDYGKMCDAWRKAILFIDPDLYIGPTIVYPASVFEALDYRLMKWPGHGLGANQIYQYVEGEYMKADEYDEFLSDPSDYMIRKYYPRVLGILEPLTQLPPLHNGMWMGILDLAGGFGAPSVAQALEKLVKAGEEVRRWNDCQAAFDREIQGLGYPNFVGGTTFAPFDLIGDTLRGTRGVLTDMHRQPEKLLQALDRLTPVAVQMGVSGAKKAANPMVWMFLHKGAGGFMSNSQFQTFYWPSLRKVMGELIQEGLTPCVYTEGDYTPRLEIIADVPRGKVLYHFETVNIRKAKETLGDVACISGNVPLSLLATGTTQDVTDYCRNLIAIMGRGGGFILDSAAGFDDVRPENVKAMSDSVKEYGVYH